METFIEDAKETFFNQHDYSLVDYVSVKTKVKIICTKHKFVWEAIPNNYLRSKSGCPKCSKRISKLENEWLDSLNISDDKEHRQVHFNILGYQKYIKVDGYDPDTNTIYEFYGDYWHGNPQVYNSFEYNQIAHKTFGELYENTIKRNTAIVGAGFNLNIMWENDWKQYNSINN